MKYRLLLASLLLLALAIGQIGMPADAMAGESQSRQPFAGSKAGDQRDIAGVKLCWCPPGTFTMGSPRSEPERRPGEDQVEVTLTQGFWMAKYEATQGQWKRVMGKLPGELTAELPEGDDFPVGNVNFAETEAFCRKLTETARAAGELPKDWEFRLPTEAQWEYACRAGTTTATSFGDKLSSKQANFQGQAVQRRRAGAVAQSGRKSRQLPGQRLGPARHARQYRSSGAAIGIIRSCPAAPIPILYSAQSTATRSEHGDISRVRRGGCWADEGWPCRSAFRLRFEPERRYDHIGFRVVAVRP